MAGQPQRTTCWFFLHVCKIYCLLNKHKHDRCLRKTKEGQWWRQEWSKEQNHDRLCLVPWSLLGEVGQRDIWKRCLHIGYLNKKRVLFIWDSDTWLGRAWWWQRKEGKWQWRRGSRCLGRCLGRAPRERLTELLREPGKKLSRSIPWTCKHLLVCQIERHGNLVEKG